MTKRALWPAANWVMFAAFLFSVVVQINDPDPLPWMLVYGVAAAACFLAARGRGGWRLPTATGLVAIAWGATIAARAESLAFSGIFDEFEMRDTGIEEAREVLGLAIIAAWMLVLAAVGRLRLRLRRPAGGRAASDAAVSAPAAVGFTAVEAPAAEGAAAPDEEVSRRPNR